MPVDGLARRPRIAPVLGAALVAALLPAAGCGPTQEESQWEPVQSYIDLDTAWHAGMNEIGRSDADAQEKARRREAVGEHPDITEAVAAAKTILDAPDHPRFGEAAEFLATHPRGMYEDADQDMARGAAALATHIGPDYSQVEAFIEEEAAWQARIDAVDESEAGEEEKSRQKAVLSDERPQAVRALAAAAAILAAGGPDQARAAEFLVAPGSRQAFIDVGYVVRGARFMLANVPDYDDWPGLIQRIGRQDAFARNTDVDAFLAEMAEFEAPAVRATARYISATRLMRRLASDSTAREDVAPMRERAVAMATGLSGGVEDEQFDAPMERSDDESESEDATFAQAEDELLYRIRHTAVGGTVPEVSGARLDGELESLAAYAGKIMLVDFWATWCGPCVGALPDLRTFYEKQPKDRFELLSVSVDEELETVVEFQKGEPMPWANWHVGDKSDMTRQWDVLAFPTYILIDGNGTILARTNRWDERLVDRIEEAVDAAGGGAPEGTV